MQEIKRTFEPNLKVIDPTVCTDGGMVNLHKLEYLIKSLNTETSSKYYAWLSKKLNTWIKGQYIHSRRSLRILNSGGTG